MTSAPGAGAGGAARRRRAVAGERRRRLAAIRRRTSWATRAWSAPTRMAPWRACARLAALVVQRHQGRRDRRWPRPRGRLRPGAGPGARLPMAPGCWTACPTCPAGWSVTAAWPPTPSASGSGTAAPVRDPAQADGRAGRLPGLDLRQPAPGREPLGTPERMAGGGHPLRENGALLPRRAQSCRHLRLAQELTDLTLPGQKRIIRLQSQGVARFCPGIQGTENAGRFRYSAQVVLTSASASSTSAQSAALTVLSPRHHGPPWRGRCAGPWPAFDPQKNTAQPVGFCFDGELVEISHAVLRRRTTRMFVFCS
jgi:hypothetical protein